jgi:hypothetical protein
MPRRRAERGEGNLGCIFWVVALAIATLICWKAIPVKIQSTQLYDYMEELAKFSAANNPSETLVKLIIDRAHQLDIPLDKKDLRIDLTRDRIVIEVDYTVPVVFPGYTYPWHFHQKLDRPIFIV